MKQPDPARQSGRRLDELAAALGRARTSHEKRPDDRLAELHYEAARAAFLDETLREKDRELRRALGEVAALRREMRVLRETVRDRIAAVMARARPKRRRRRGAADAPLFDGAGA